jgi:phosphoribosylanthranilate isomerase
MKFKVCGLRNEENILQVLACKPDFLGFIFYAESPRYVGTELSVEFAQSITGTKKVGVFVNESEVSILDIASRYGLDLIQLHGNETAEFCTRIKKYIPVIKAFQIDDDFDFSLLNEYENSCDYFLFDTKSEQFGGSGRAFNRKRLEAYTLQKAFFISGGIDLGSVSEILRLKSQYSHLISIDVNSCFEIEPGIKDINRIKQLEYIIANNQ